MTEELLTYRDAYEHLLDTTGLVGKDQDSTVRLLRRAIVEAYRKLPTLHDWAYFNRTTMLHTDASYSTGTIAYDYATNVLTLTGGTLPTNAAYGHVVIGEQEYKVARRLTATTLAFDANSRPSDDVAASTAYRWGRHRYLLPIDVGDITSINDNVSHNNLIRVEPEQLFWRMQYTNTETFPTTWAMVRSEDFPGRWELWFASTDTTIRELQLLYTTRFTSLPIEQITGTVGITDDIATMTTAVLTSDCVGAVLRYGTGTSLPTPRVGSWDADAGESVLVLPEGELIITQFTSTTVAVLSRPLASAVTTRGVTISSHIDVNPSSMWELFMRLCEYQYDVITRADQSKQMQSEANWRNAFVQARIADARRPGTSNTWPVWPTVSNDEVN